MFVCQRYICPLKISLYTFSNRCGFPYEVVVVTICNKYRIIYVKYTWQFLLDNNKTLILFHVLRICLTIGKFVYLRYIVIENEKLVHHFHAQHPPFQQYLWTMTKIGNRSATSIAKTGRALQSLIYLLLCFNCLLWINENYLIFFCDLFL